jgi:hypothetical protein
MSEPWWKQTPEPPADNDVSVESGGVDFNGRPLPPYEGTMARPGVYRNEWPADWEPAADSLDAVRRVFDQGPSPTAVGASVAAMNDALLARSGDRLELTSRWAGAARRLRAEIDRLVNAYGDARDGYGWLCAIHGDDSADACSAEANLRRIRRDLDAALDRALGLEPRVAEADRQAALEALSPTPRIIDEEETE